LKTGGREPEPREPSPRADSNGDEAPVFSIDRYVYSWTINGRIDAA